MVRQSICFIRITTFHTSAIILIRGEMIRSGPWLVISHPCALWLPYTSQSYFPERATNKTVEIYRLWFFSYIYLFLISETVDHVTEWHHGCSEANGNTLLSECVCPGMTASLWLRTTAPCSCAKNTLEIKWRDEDRKIPRGNAVIVLPGPWIYVVCDLASADASRDEQRRSGSGNFRLKCWTELRHRLWWSKNVSPIYLKCDVCVW